MKYRAICENHLYSKAYKKGKRVVTRTVAVYLLPDYKRRALMLQNPEKKYINRIGLTVGKKIGGAVVRSRAKRLLRHAYRNIDKARGVKTGHLIVLVAREEIVGKKTGDVERDLLYALRKLELLCETL
ncbi:MAG: ribonuclease P protein component [Clostridia bacterium]|nr:ribonuclease P protein component [Clostridia bacterium]